MSFVDKKCWRIQGKLRTLSRMSEGAIKYFCIAVLGTASVFFAQDVPVPPSLPGTDPAVLTTNAVPVIIAPTNSPAGEVLPIVEGGTNTVLSAEERENAEFEKARIEAEEGYEKKLADAKTKWEAATNSLGIYHLIPERNPFKLIKQEIEKPKVRIVSTITVGVPHLAGISRLRNKLRAVLRINPPRGGPAEYKFIEVGEMVDGVEVLKIDPLQPDGTGGVVEVKVKNKTHTLELNKNTLASFKSNVRPSGSSYRPGSSSNRSSATPPRGSSSRNTSSSKGTSDREKRMAEWKKKMEERRGSGSSRGSESSPRRPSGSSGGLKGVPRRRGGSSSLEKIRPIGSDLYELPAFNEVVQKQIIDPLNISTQREIIRGQLSYETPTDLPGNRR